MSNRAISSKEFPSGRTQVIPALKILLLAIAIAAFVYLALQFNFIQDDAYISFRYAGNLLSGKGLVYNVGERVEGYTNFLWVILLALSKKILLIDYITTARILSLTCGGLIFVITFLFAGFHSKERHLPIFLASAALLLSNQALEYWSVSGLETTAFAFLCILSLYLEHVRPRFTAAALVVATLIRPEGGLLFFIIFLHRIIKQRRFPFHLLLVYFLLLAPLGIFKLLYYGSLIPNPFYAKAGFGLEYITSGLEYLWQFVSTMGIYGLIFLVPLLALPNLWKKYSLLYIFLGIYLLYIVYVGGDVLKVYRFIVPILPALFFLFAISLDSLLTPLLARRKIKSYWPRFLTVGFAISIGILSFALSRNHVNTFWNNEKKLTEKMQYTGQMLRKHMGSDFSVAASTIGALGYELMGHRVIDMLGLTDPYIARNPEHIEGLRTTWKERRFNNHYLLEQHPDYIIFSTNFKPSAPAERALMLHSEFRAKYSPSGFPQRGSIEWAIFYRREGNIDLKNDRIHPDIIFANEVSEGFSQLARGNLIASYNALEKADKNLGEDCPLLYAAMGEILLRRNMLDSSVVMLDRAVRLDPESWMARMSLATIARLTGDSAAMNEQIYEIDRFAPWTFQQ